MQDLAEYYMPAFQQCARDSKVGSIMCSYNALNGVPTCADTYVLQTVLRDHWNWTDSNNYITSDCEAVADIALNHKYAKTNAEGTALAFEAGMDNSCEYSGSSDIPGAWAQGLLKVPVIDKALRRQYEGLVRAGYFDGSKALYASLSPKDIETKRAEELNLQITKEGLVMLKNDKTLPISLTNGSKVAMVGFWANDTTKLKGIYSGPSSYLRTPVYAGAQLGLKMAVSSGPVLQTTSARDNWTTNALAAASKSDYIIYFGGLDTSAAAETQDRTSISWPTAQLALIRKLATLGKPLVVVVLGDMVDNTPLLQDKGVNSLIWANWPGPEGGPAVMSAISGHSSIAGRLPVTQYPANYTSYSMLNMNLRPNANIPGRTYRWFKSPVQPFGFGLHYTTFKPSFAGPKKLSINIQDVLKKCKNQYRDTCAVPAIQAKVTNTGNRTSDFVTLAFIKGDVGPKPYPLKTLISYTRLREVKTSQTQDVTLPITLGNLARVDEQGNTVVYPGKYTLMLDEPTQAETTLEITGKMAVLDYWPHPNGTDKYRI